MSQKLVVPMVLLALAVVVMGCAPMAAPASTTAPVASPLPSAPPPAVQPASPISPPATATAEVEPTTAPATSTVAPSVATSTTAIEPTGALAPSAAPAASATSASSAGAATPAAASGGPQVTVKMEKYAYVPKNATVAPGTTVIWINGDDTTHTVTADDHSFDSGDMQLNREFRYTFTKTGVYPYYCVWHGSAGGQGMSGTITVK